MITNEMRARIFAAYWGCNVTKTNNPVGGYPLDYVVMANIANGNKKHFLLLHEIRNITDEHAVEVACKGWRNREAFEVLEIKRDTQCISINYRWRHENPKLNNKDGYAYSGVAFYYTKVLTRGECDYLRPLGYDCGYGDIPSLIAAGIAKPINNKIEK